MKITKEELSSIIREELQATLGEKIVSRPAALQEDVMLMFRQHVAS